MPPLAAVLAGIWLAGCATRPPAPAVALEAPKPYLRVDRAPDRTLSLQVASRKLQGPSRRSPVIWLVSASHLGESNYFASLQRQLDACELVLFEGVGGAPQKRKAEPAGTNAALSSLQTTLAESLGLVFQLDAIDYDRKHFKNSDIGIEQIQQLIAGTTNLASSSEPGPAAPAPTAAGRGMQDLLGIMDGSSLMGALAHTAVRMISVSPRLQATVKVVFIETLGSLEGDIAQAKGLPPDLRELMQFIIRERNEVVLRDLKAALQAKRPPRSIAIFYGAGHMHDLERRIGEELRFRPAGDTWLTAFAINPRAAGLSDAELNLVRGMVKWQMEQLQQ